MKIALRKLRAAASALLVVMLSVSPVGASGSGACSVSPNPTSGSSDITVTATGLAASASYTVRFDTTIKNAVLTTVETSDADGTIVTGYHMFMNPPGTGTIRFSRSGGPNARCTVKVT